MPESHKRLGELLLEARLITPDQLNTALSDQRRNHQLLGSTLVRLGFITEKAILLTLHHQLGLPVVDLKKAAIEERAIGMIRKELAKKHQAIPIEVAGRYLVVAVADPLNAAALEDLRFQSGLFIKPVLSAPSDILAAIARHYQTEASLGEVINSIIESTEEVEVSRVSEQETAEEADDLRREAEGRPIVQLTNWLLSQAVSARASDIHIEPMEKELLIRIRVDGLLQEVQHLSKRAQSALISRIKVLADMDIAEKRKPQDGRLVAQIGSRRIDMRVSTLPITNGEKVVIRVVDQARAPDSLDNFDFLPRDYERFRGFLDRPQGIVVVTGPTGSGKTSLLYASLRYLQNVTRNIVTVEDPVEFRLPGINQVQVDEKAKKTFPTALRAILRQDPDIIMIGEIRDKETAQIAFRASITGHQVLTTVHTNDTATAITRLFDLGLDPFMVASSLVGLVSMRLVRVLCPHCRTPYTPEEAEVSRLRPRSGIEAPLQLYRSVGCGECRNTGFSGRTGIFEVMQVDEAIRSLINRGASDTLIRQAATGGGMRTLGEDGLRRVLEGQTTLEEIGRVIYVAQQTAKVCPSCTFVLSQEFEYCPSCGTFVGDNCRSCHRRGLADWGFCPFCGQGADPQGAPHKLTAEVSIAASKGTERQRRQAQVTEIEGPTRKAS